MKIFKLSIITMFCFCFIFMNSIVCLACDMTLNSKEENYLLYYNLIKNSCQGSEYKNRNCTKYLVRYNGLESKIGEIKKLINEEKRVSRTENLEKVGIVTTGIAPIGIGLYYAPITTVLTTLLLSLGSSAVCIAHNEIIKPTGKALGYIPNSIIKVVEYFTGGNSEPTPDVGIIGDAIITLCGDSSKVDPKEGLLERIRKLIFGKKISDTRKTKEKEAYEELLDEFYKQVKERKFEGNNILMMCMDSTDINNIKSKLKFKHTHVNISYKKKIENYFKKWL